MIVVVGLPAYAEGQDGHPCAEGLAVHIAAAARERGSDVELVGKVGDDGAGDAVVVALGRAGVGHAALLRDPARPTPVMAPAGDANGAGDEAPDDERPLVLFPADPADRPGLEAGDVELALRYVTGARVVVVADPLSDQALAAAAEGASFSSARLVVLMPAGAPAPSLPGEATVLEMPASDDGSFGRLLGLFAAALDSGLGPGLAFSQAVEASGWEAVGG